MNTVVNVKIIENNSVNRKMEEVAVKLSNKYNKKRNINESLLKQKTPLQKFFTCLLNTLSIVVFVFALVFCFSAFFNRFQNMPPSIGGYFCMRVSSTSMVNSGFDIGDNVIVRSVNTKTLKEGDIIAFYRDESFIDGMNDFEIVPTNSIPQTEYTLNVAKFFGIQPAHIKQAAKNNKLLVFHHIRQVFEDENGNRYFKTYGSSNLFDKKGEVIDSNIDFDTSLVQEKMVIGIYTNSKLAKTMASMLNIVSTPQGAFVVLIIPVCILVISLFISSFKNVQLAFLENDVVEEKRKLTDPICVKHGIGYRMNKKTKYKVLAQAEDDEKLQYINLLWKTDNRPQNIRKYYLRKGLIIRPMQKLRDLNRECEQMFKDNVSPTKIAKYYSTQKAKIKAQEKRYKALLKKVALSKNKEKENAKDNQIKQMISINQKNKKAIKN